MESIFKEHIIPQALQSGCFGENPEVIEVEEDCFQGKDQFMSSVKCVEVKLKVGGVERKFSLFCKLQSESASDWKRNEFQTDLQFFNEVFVYKEIVPYYAKKISNILPKFYFGVANLKRSLERDVIILENLNTVGFKQTDERIFLDFEHCSLVFEKLGELHGASIQLKAENPLKFGNKINQLLETKWLENHKEKQNYFLGENAKRGVIPLVKKGEHLEILNEFLERLNDVHGIIKDILEVNELNVLCHGDFCRNNMAFKYLEGHPVEVKFYDFGTARYASPVIDISFFLFLNMASEHRRKHFKEDLLNIYLHSVQRIAGLAAPTMEELWEEFQKKAVYGYILVSFFLPIMWEGNHDLQNIGVEQKTKRNLSKGGQDVTDKLSDVVRDLIAWGCLVNSGTDNV